MLLFEVAPSHCKKQLYVNGAAHRKTFILSGYEESGPKVESWEGESMGKQSSHPEKDC